MKKLFSIKVKEPKIRKTLPSELVVSKVHKSAKDFKRKKIRLQDVDLLDD
jgi:hypothetical protein